MKTELDDPKLTAYALGELDDAEKAEVEAFLNENEAARNEVAQIREAAQWLTTELAAGQPEGLSELEQARIMDQAKKAGPVQRINWGRWVAVAALLIVVGLGFGIYPRMIMRAGGTHGYSMMTAKGQAVSLTPAVNEGGSVSASAPKPEAGKVEISPERLRESGQLPAASATKFGEQTDAKATGQQLPVGDDEAARHAATASAPVPAPAAEKPKAEQKAGLPSPEAFAQPVAASAPAAAPAAPAAQGVSGGLQNEQAGARLNVRADFYDASKPKEEQEGLRALGYVGANAPGMPEKKKDLSGSPMVLGLDARILPQPVPIPPPPPTPVPGSETYPVLPENTFQRVADAPLSTFGLDVDTASYANVRRFLNQGTLPPAEAVRIEELVNYFKYDYPKPEGDSPFSVTVDAHPCPWAPTHTLARIGVRGRDLNTETRPPANLVFLIDVSGSMQDPDKLPLLKQGMKLLTQTVTANDRVSIVTYASGTGVALYPTPGDNKASIERIIDSLSAGGSTNGAGGIQLAYDLARRAFIQGGVNRVILATDGDFNVGISDTGTLVSMIEQQAKTGVALSVLGFGQGNLKDERMMRLADKGNGNYAYIDSFQEARKVLLEQATGTLFTIAKDVKIQIEFNPARVGAYRLIGYEKRMLAAQDFNDDRKDAGEIGAGHTVTALYELVPPGEPVSPAQVDPLKYQQNPEPAPAPAASDSPELMTVKMRFKPPTGDVSTRFDVPVPATVVTAETKPDFQFASAVAAFGMLLRHSAYAGTANMDMVANLAQQGRGTDENGLRAEFINLARTASALMGTPQPQPVLE